jgi:uncharacterized membrane protein
MDPPPLAFALPPTRAPSLPRPPPLPQASIYFPTVLENLGILSAHYTSKAESDAARVEVSRPLLSHPPPGRPTPAVDLGSGPADADADAYAHSPAAHGLSSPHNSAAQTATLVTFWVGVIFLLMGLFKLGLLIRYLSHSVCIPCVPSTSTCANLSVALVLMRRS